MFQQLYAIESRIKNVSLNADEILNLRQTETVPVLKVMKQWMTEEYIKLLPSSPISKAIAYCLPYWDKLGIYTTDARLNIDNNPVENVIRPVAIGRKNYLFAGSHEAAQRAAMIYSFFNTCRLHKINPYEWLKDVLECTATQLLTYMNCCYKIGVKIKGQRSVSRWLTLLRLLIV